LFKSAGLGFDRVFDSDDEGAFITTLDPDWKNIIEFVYQAGQSKSTVLALSRSQSSSSTLTLFASRRVSDVPMSLNSRHLPVTFRECTRVRECRSRRHDAIARVQ